MNRLPQVATDRSTALPVSFALDGEESDARRAAARGRAPVALFTPLHYEPNYAYPLFVWLHGTDQDEQQLRLLMPAVSMRNYAGVAPRGTIGVSSPRGGRRRYRWSPASSQLASAEQRIFEAVEAAQAQWHIAPRRVFLAGADEGGTIALQVALRHPHRFAGVLSVGGLLPSGGAPLARLNAARRLPVFLAYGQAWGDRTQNRACNDLRLLHAAGFDVTLRLYPGGGEDDASPLGDPRQEAVSERLLGDIDRWMMELVVGSRLVAPAQRS